MSIGDTVLVTEEVLNVMRGSVTYAVEYGSQFVGPAHLLLALLDDPKIGDTLRDAVERGRIIAAARQPAPGGLVEVQEGPLPRGEQAPFQRYDTLVFQSTDGKQQRWLNRDTFGIFNEAARRVDGGRFLPKHIAVGFAIDAQNDRDVRTLLGRDPQVFSELAYAL